MLHVTLFNGAQRSAGCQLQRGIGGAPAPPPLSGAQRRLTDQVHWTALRAKVQHILRDIDAPLLPTTMLPALPVETVDASPEVYTEHNLQYLRNTTIATCLTCAASPCPVGLPARSYPLA
jgi:Asp-tRNA(Asn)/Glu-tRNA(Gln) amidotransferase A subunit family amidase